MIRCTEPGCLRKPAFPDQSKCAEHRVRWQPEWVRRAQAKQLDPKVLA